MLLVAVRSYLKSVLRHRLLILDIHHPNTPYLCEQGCEDPWLFYETTRGSRAKKLWETSHASWHSSESCAKVPRDGTTGHIFNISIQAACCQQRGPSQLNRYSDSLAASRSRDQIPVGARLSAPVQNGPGAYPASCTMGTGLFCRGGKEAAACR